MPLDRSRLSVVIPIYNERAILPELARRLLATFNNLPFDDHEVMFVSDGSTDGSNELLGELVEDNPEFKAVLLSRNFGHQAAVSTGLSHASGSVVCVLDGDLQDPPEVLADLVEALADGADVAYAVRRKRKEHVLKRAAYAVFYRTMAAMSSIDIPLDAGDFCCMRRQVVDDMLRLPERTRFVRGLRAWVGYQQVGVEYERHERVAGRSKFTLRKLLGLAYDGIFSFSNLPIKVMQFIGFFISTAAMVTALTYLAWYFIAPGRFPAGWATVVISLWFIGGVQLMFMGLLGEYVFRTFDEARARPTALVRQVIVNQQAKEPTCEVITPKPTRLYTRLTGRGRRASRSSSTRYAA